MTNVDADDHAVGRFGRWEDGFVLEGEDLFVDVVGVGGGELVQDFIALACELEHGLLAVDLHFSWVFEILVESPAEGIASCGGGDYEVSSMVRTGEHLMSWWGSALWDWGRSEEVGVFTVCPV